jgi:hypothetical protein
MYKTFFKNYFFFALLILFVASCDNNYNELGSDIVGNDHFEYGEPETYEVSTVNNKSLGAVESTDLPINALGIYDNPIFGKIKAHFATQIQLAALNPTIAANPVLDSVVLRIPYFSKKGTTENGKTPYTLDSIYGPEAGKLKLHIYESKYYIRDLDPLSATQESQKYYTNQNADFDNDGARGQWLNDSAATGQNDVFGFDPTEMSITVPPKTEGGNPTYTRSAPGMHVYLNKDFFQNKIFGTAATGKLLNNNIFKEYFRGLYFNVDNVTGTDPALAMINFKGGAITLYYKEDKSVPKKDADGNIMRDADNNIIYEIIRDPKTLLLTLNGKSVSLHENTPLPMPLSDRLYIKGGDDPSMAVINLFPGVDSDNDGISDELEALRAKKWLVNDASLTFTIDNTAMGTTAIEPNRIYLYDLKNKRPIVDYYSDQTTNAGKTNYGKTTFSGIIKKVNGRGTEYKIRLTNHLRGLISKDSTNVQLGLVVTQNINTIGNKKLRSTATNGLDYLPSASIMNPFGTILYSNTVPVGDDYSKRLKLKIYFTKRKQD